VQWDVKPYSNQPLTAVSDNVNFQLSSAEVVMAQCAILMTFNDHYTCQLAL